MGDARYPVILQARLGSTRLPGKALLPLAGKPLLARVLESLLAAGRVSRVIVAMPANSVDGLGPVAAACGCPVVVGPEDDVLERYRLALAAHPAPHFYRATGDNPFVSAELVDRLADEHEAADADLTHFLGIPLGTGVELVRASALLAAAAEAVDPYEREHVTPFLYRRRDRFRVLEPDLGLGGGLRVTVDTAADLARAEALAAALGAVPGGPGFPFPLTGILAMFASRPELFAAE